MPKPKKPRKPRTHITISGPILRAAEALAHLRDMTLSELIEDELSALLKEHGCAPEVTAQQIASEIERLAKVRKEK